MDAGDEDLTLLIRGPLRLAVHGECFTGGLVAFILISLTTNELELCVLQARTISRIGLLDVQLAPVGLYLVGVTLVLTCANTVVEVKRRFVRDYLNICRCLGLDAHLDGLAILASCLKLGHCGVLELDIDLVRATRGDFHIVVRIGQSLTGAGQFNGDVFLLRSLQLAVQVVLYAVGNKLVLVGSRCRDGSSNGVVVGVTTVGISVLHFLGHASFGVLRVHNHIIDGGLAIPGRCRNRNQEVRARDILVVRNRNFVY